MKPTFAPNDQKALAEFVVSNLPKHKLFSLGTVDEDQKPWVVCLNLSYDHELNIIWKSKKDTEHSKHIVNNKNVSICIYSDDTNIGDFGFYAKATVREIQDKDELAKYLHVRCKQKGKAVPDLDDFLGASEYRIYAATITEAWVNDQRQLKMLVDMDVLRKALTCAVFNREMLEWLHYEIDERECRKV